MQATLIEFCYKRLEAFVQNTIYFQQQPYYQVKWATWCFLEILITIPNILTSRQL
jgi:hypothetical protein